MAMLDMKGPYSFTSESINKHVTQTSPGNYALGSAADKGFFIPKYIGRADVDIKKRLHNWIGMKNHFQFKFSYATSPKDAFLKECKNWHAFKPMENPDHPAKPENTDWRCPECGIII